jgi:hypothetical protein
LKLDPRLREAAATGIPLQRVAPVEPR